LAPLSSVPAQSATPGLPGGQHHQSTAGWNCR